MISLISKFSGSTVLWVDDRVELTDEEILKIADNGGGTYSSLAALDQTWADVVLAGKGSELPDEGLKNFAAAASILMEVCEGCCTNLSLMSFREATFHVVEPQMIFLLDLLNATKPLGTTPADVGWNWDFYGAEFVKHHAIKKERFRFVSRFRARAGDPVKDILPLYFTEDATVLAHSLRLEDLASLRANFDAFLKLNSLHPDPALNEAIVFALSPPDTSTHWEHDLLQPNYGNPPATGPHNAALAKWIGCAVDEDSAKALLCGSFSDIPWKIKSGASRILRAEIFRAACAKCRLSIETNGVEKLLLPVQPGFPFLLALCVLIRQMETAERYHPPTQITVTQIGERFQLRLELNPQAKAADAVVDMDAFEKAYATALTDAVDGHNLTSRRLVDLTKAKVTPKYPISDAKSPFVNGTDHAAAEVSFDKNQPAVIISWPL